MKSTLLAAASLFALMGGAQAADLPRRAAPPPVIAAPPAFTWTGFYAGVNAGGAVGGDFRVATTAPRPAALPPSRAEVSAAGFEAGGTVGYNYQFTPNDGFVVGVEADAGYSDLHRAYRVSAGATQTAIGGMKTDTYFVTVRGRVGYAWGPLLAYVTGGWAFTEIGARGTVAAPGRIPTTPFNTTIPVDGYTVGAGLEYLITPNLSVKGEYLYADFARDIRFRAFGTQFGVRTGLDVHQLKIGINYHFNLFN
ncbi:outer membrane protein [Methylobacterium nonmethylotrophicum]|uniref:Porin family protein n=1 Tax=Methylobacterium nonmethylotrophicum TaxID=1141884 RepID=A0A4Z0NX28_9HYPH|nr:outer membrane beta-barrel protein [Methylobacterium nonmethylotrophicum]TGE01829.1 porin family protein [Methylobacterium nonmethylotrophicum]